MTENNSLTIQNRTGSSWVFRGISCDSRTDSEHHWLYKGIYVLEGMLWPEIFTMDEV